MKKFKEKKFKLFIICPIIFIAFLFGCTANDYPKQSNKTKVTIHDDHRIKYNKSFELKWGIFISLTFPSKEEDYFQACVDTDYEPCYEIQAPDGFNFDEILERTDFNWKFTLEKIENNTLQYRIEKKDKAEYLLLELPFYTNKYSFAVLKNIRGEELILYGNTSNYDKKFQGYFGYLMIE